MTLSLEVIADEAELERLGPAWEALLERSMANEPTLSAGWLLTWWRIFGPTGGRRLRVVLFYSGKRLVALAPLLERVHWYSPGIPFRRLELLGSGEDERDEICSDYLGFIAESEASAEVAAAFARALGAGALGPWDELVLPALNAESPLSTGLGEDLLQHGLQAVIEPAGGCPYIPLPASWEAYLGQLSSSHRYLVSRSLRDFEKWAAGRHTYGRVENAADLAVGKQMLLALHAERWQARGRTGAFDSTRFAAFHDRVLPLLLERGALELAWLVVADEPIAVLYNILWNRKVFFYQSGRKVDLPKQIRPGIVLHAHAIQRAIARGDREYDFLAGTSQYKTQLALATRPLVQLRASRAPLRESARQLAGGAGDRLRALRNELAPRLRLPTSWRRH